MLAFLLTAAMLHPVHETVSEVEWNEKSHRLEVALRLDALDEEWLRMQAGDPADVSKWTIAYLRRKFRITDAHPGVTTADAPIADGGPPAKNVPQARDDSSATYHWIGSEDRGSFVWWYFEIEPVDHQRPQWIDVRLLWERNENYVNRILVLGQQPRRAFTLTTQRPKAPFGDAAREQPLSSKPDR
jgi:hypothetical protein